MRGLLLLLLLLLLYRCVLRLELLVGSCVSAWLLLLAFVTWLLRIFTLGCAIVSSLELLLLRVTRWYSLLLSPSILLDLLLLLALHLLLLLIILLLFELLLSLELLWVDVLVFLVVVKMLLCLLLVLRILKYKYHILDVVIDTLTGDALAGLYVVLRPFVLMTALLADELIISERLLLLGRGLSSTWNLHEFGFVGFQSSLINFKENRSWIFLIAKVVAALVWIHALLGIQRVRELAFPTLPGCNHLLLRWFA
mmetsp:Transcript_8248/g.12619  ORF Transcript_8248/g.12619 Transcript_8248/m.12619 type:complete len:253 (+) Transcript_8248:702-1460(+)